MKPTILVFFLVLSSCSLFFPESDPDPLAKDRNNGKFIQITTRSDSGILIVNGKDYLSDPKSFTTTHTLEAVGLVNFLIYFTPSAEFIFDSFSLTSGGVSRRIYTNPILLDVENSSVYLEVNLKSQVQDPPLVASPRIASLQAIPGNDKLYLRSWNTHSPGFLYNPTDGSFLPGDILEGVADISGKIVSFGGNSSAIMADVWSDGLGAYSLYNPPEEQILSFPWVDDQDLNFLCQESIPTGRPLELKTWNWKSSVLSTKTITFKDTFPDVMDHLDVSYGFTIPLDADTSFVQTNVGVLILKKSQGILHSLKNPLLWGLRLVSVDKVNRKCLAYRSGEYDGATPAWYWIDAQGYETQERSLGSDERLIPSEGSPWNILKNENEIWEWIPGTGGRSLQLVVAFKVSAMVSSGDGRFLYFTSMDTDQAFYRFQKETKELKKIPLFE